MNCNFLSETRSEISGGIENVLLRNITVTSNAHGAYIKANNQRGGFIRNVTYQDIHFVNTTDVIRIWGTFESHIFGTHYPEIDGVNFVSLTGVGTGGRDGKCGSLDCYLIRPCRNIEVRNSHFDCSGGFTCEYVHGTSLNDTPKLCF